MRKIVNGKRYDTNNAESVAETSSHEGRTDFRWFEEELFRTAKGMYFLAGKGGPMTKYATPVGNNGMSGGSDIIPLTHRETLEWFEHANLDVPETCPEILALITDA